VTPLGFDRFKIVEWLHALVQLHDEQICKKLGELSFPQCLLEMMLTYVMNSFLHLKIYSIFEEAIKTQLEDYIKTVSVYLIVVRY
jgi:hypothetical protein